MYEEYRMYIEDLLCMFSGSGTETVVRLLSNDSKKITVEESDTPKIRVKDGNKLIQLTLYKNSFDSRIPKVNFEANCVPSKDTITILAEIQVEDEEVKYRVNFDPTDASDRHYALEEFSNYICSALKIE